MGVDPTAPTESGWQPLQIACKQGHLTILQELIERGVNPDEDKVAGMLPIHIACQLGTPETVVYLCENKVSLNNTGVDGNTALHYACIRGDDAIIDTLIKHNTDLNFQNNTGQTPLHIAIENKNIKLAEALIRAGARSDIEDSKGQNAINASLEFQLLDIYSLLNKTIKVSRKHRDSASDSDSDSEDWYKKIKLDRENHKLIRTNPKVLPRVSILYKDQIIGQFVEDELLAFEFLSKSFTYNQAKSKNGFAFECINEIDAKLFMALSRELDGNGGMPEILTPRECVNRLNALDYLCTNHTMLPPAVCGFQRCLETILQVENEAEKNALLTDLAYGVKAQISQNLPENKKEKLLEDAQRRARAQKRRNTIRKESHTENENQENQENTDPTLELFAEANQKEWSNLVTECLANISEERLIPELALFSMGTLGPIAYDPTEKSLQLLLPNGAQRNIPLLDNEWPNSPTKIITQDDRIILTGRSYVKVFKLTSSGFITQHAYDDTNNPPKQFIIFNNGKIAYQTEMNVIGGSSRQTQATIINEHGEAATVVMQNGPYNWSKDGHIYAYNSPRINFYHLKADEQQPTLSYVGHNILDLQEDTRIDEGMNSFEWGSNNTLKVHTKRTELHGIGSSQWYHIANHVHTINIPKAPLIDYAADILIGSDAYQQEENEQTNAQTSTNSGQNSETSQALQTRNVMSLNEFIEMAQGDDFCYDVTSPSKPVPLVLVAGTDLRRLQNYIVSQFGYALLIEASDVGGRYSQQATLVKIRHRYKPDDLAIIKNSGATLANDTESLSQFTQSIAKIINIHFQRPFLYNQGGPASALTTDDITVQRPNHCIGHGLRQGLLARRIAYEINNGFHPNINPQVCEFTKERIASDPLFMDKLQFVSSFQRTGRESETSYDQDPNTYLDYGKTDVIYFKQAADKTNLFADRNEIEFFAAGLMDACTSMGLETQLGCLLFAAHTFDHLRMWGYRDNSAFVRSQKMVFDKLMRNGFLTSEAGREFVKGLACFESKLLRASGVNRFMSFKPTYFEQQQNPSEMAKKLVIAYRSSSLSGFMKSDSPSETMPPQNENSASGQTLAI